MEIDFMEKRKSFYFGGVDKHREIFFLHQTFLSGVDKHRDIFPLVFVSPLSESLSLTRPHRRILQTSRICRLPPSRVKIFPHPCPFTLPRVPFFILSIGFSKRFVCVCVCVYAYRVCVCVCMCVCVCHCVCMCAGFLLCHN